MDEESLKFIEKYLKAPFEGDSVNIGDIAEHIGWLHDSCKELCKEIRRSRREEDFLEMGTVSHEGKVIGKIEGRFVPHDRSRTEGD